MAIEHLHRVRFHDCDPAGIIFFGQVLYYCHDAYEEFLRSGGHPLQSILDGPVTYPLKHAEADYSAPFRTGDLVRVRAVVGKLSERSWRMDYVLTSEAGAPLARGATVHVAVDRATGKAMQIPASLRAHLAAHLEAAPA